MSQRNILILVENLPVPFDRRVWMEAKALRDAGYGVSVICPLGNCARRREVLEGISIYRYALTSRDGLIGHLWEYAVALVATSGLCCVVLFREGFDVIQSANPPDLFFLIGACFKLFGKKFIFDHHDLMPESCETRWKGAKLKLMRGLCLAAERATFWTSDWVIATNESYRQVALSRGRVPPDRVTVVRSSPSLEAFRPCQPDPSLRQGRAHLVCYLGVMGPNDGLDYLLRVIDYVVHDLGRQDTCFALIGSGDLAPELMRLAGELEVAEFVRFTGRISDEELIAWLSTADVCVAPDPMDPLNNLSTMNKIVEYMALGKPIVAFDLREHRVSAGDAALYARPNDVVEFAAKIITLLDDPASRQAMGEYARHRFEGELAWEHQRPALLSVYRALLGAPAGKPRQEVCT